MLVVPSHLVLGWFRVFLPNTSPTFIIKAHGKGTLVTKGPLEVINSDLMFGT
jgi:hypothetical protein